MKKLLLASLLCSTAAYAADDQWMVYGLGTETCQVAMNHDWLENGEAQWIAGAMSVMDAAAPKHEMMPVTDDARPLFALVLKQCRAKPFETLIKAANDIANSLISAQEGSTKGSQRF